MYVSRHDSTTANLHVGKDYDTIGCVVKMKMMMDTVAWTVYSRYAGKKGCFLDGAVWRLFYVCTYVFMGVGWEWDTGTLFEDLRGGVGFFGGFVEGKEEEEEEEGVSGISILSVTIICDGGVRYCYLARRGCGCGCGTDDWACGRVSFILFTFLGHLCMMPGWSMARPSWGGSFAL